MDSTAIHPGQVLLDEVMLPLGISSAQLARDLDVPSGRMRAIFLGQDAITADMALRLARHFGTTAELWMKLQSDYDLAVARTEAWPEIEPRVRIFDAPREEIGRPAPAHEVERKPAPRNDETSASPEELPILELTQRVDPVGKARDLAADDIDIPLPRSARAFRPRRQWIR